MRQPSLYAYFDSKHALYDAMFADGNRQLLDAPRRTAAAGRSPRRGEDVHAASSSTSRSRTPPRYALLFQRPIPGFEPSPDVVRVAEEVLDRAVELMHAAGVDEPGRRRLLRRDGRRPHRRADQQRSRRRPLDPPPRPSHRPVRRRRRSQGGSRTDDHRNRIQRPEARVLAEEEFVRFAELVGSLSRRRVDAADRLHRLGRPQGRAARARLGRRAGIVPAVRAPAPARRAAQQGDRLAPLGRRHERAADPRARAPVERRARRAARGGRARRRCKGRWRTPPPMRYLPIPFGPPDRVGRRSSTCSTSASPATSGPTASTSARRPAATMDLTADHDGRLVADIVGEWAAIHGQPFELVLEGPAGGKFSQGAGGERVEIDAIDFIRILSGRLPGTGVLSPSAPPLRRRHPMETTRRRDRRPHLPPLHLRSRHRADRLHVQPVPRRRRRAAALPHRPTRACSRRCRRPSRRCMPLERLRWITFGHLEADECGAMNQFLAAAPDAQVAHSAIGCMVSINDLADRAPEPLGPDRCSTSAASASATSTRPTSPTAGTRTCSTRRPPARCSAAISSPRSATGPR